MRHRPAFRHERLHGVDCIRVLDLLPAKDVHDPVVCRVREIALPETSAASPYLALSYVWGAIEGEKEIICNDAIMSVTKNCWWALIILRKARDVRTLWIDAICIDQGTAPEALRERGQQVAMMGEIYRLARMVIVWLGPGNHALTRQAFAKISGGDGDGEGTTASESSDRRSQGLYQNLSGVLQKIVTRKHGKDPQNSRASDDEVANEIEAIFRNPWFLRVWTIQEATFAARCRVLCGYALMPWDAMADGLAERASTSDHTMWLPGMGRTGARALLEDFRAEAQGDVDPDLRWRLELLEMSLLTSLMVFESTLPVDKVFSVYPLLNDQLSLPNPDYTKSVAEVYRETTLCWMRARRKLSILNLAIRVQDDDEFPTWIPRWSTKPDAVSQQDKWKEALMAGHFLKRQSNSFCASKGSVPSTTHSPLHDTNQLLLRGLRLASVKSYRYDMEIAHPAGGGVSQHPYRTSKTFVDFCKTVHDLQARSCGQNLRDDFIESHLSAAHQVMPDEVDDAELARGREAFVTLFDLMLYPDCVETDTTLFEVADDASPRQIIEYYMQILSALHEKQRVQALQIAVDMLEANSERFESLLVLDAGYVGQGFCNVADGDEAFLLEGLDNPAILRRDGEYYRFVTPAYIPGIMYGERWPDDSRHLQDLVLV